MMACCASGGWGKRTTADMFVTAATSSDTPFTPTGAMLSNHMQQLLCGCDGLCAVSFKRCLGDCFKSVLHSELNGAQCVCLAAGTGKQAACCGART